MTERGNSEGAGIKIGWGGDAGVFHCDGFKDEDRWGHWGGLAADDQTS